MGFSQGYNYCILLLHQIGRSSDEDKDKVQ